MSERTAKNHRRAIDRFFEELEKNPYFGCPEGCTRGMLELQNAYHSRNCAIRQITVLTSRIESVLERMNGLVYSLMENPLDDDEVVLGSLEHLNLEINQLEDQVKMAEFDLAVVTDFIEKSKYLAQYEGEKYA